MLIHLKIELFEVSKFRSNQESDSLEVEREQKTNSQQFLDQIEWISKQPIKNLVSNQTKVFPTDI